MTKFQQHAQQPNHTHSMVSKSKLVLAGFLVVAGYFLITEHRAHLGGALYYLPFLFLLACPLLHMFMHGSHHHGTEKGRNDKKTGGP
jgi:hypothetical protein